MAKPYDLSMRPVATSHVFFDQAFNKMPSVSSMLHKGIYEGLSAASVANFNPKYAFFYGFVRGSTDFLTATLQYDLLFKGENGHLEDEGFADSAVMKSMYVAVNIMASITIVYAVTKVGEFTYWGAKSLIGKADYRPFGILQLIKIEAVTFLATTLFDLGANGIDKLLTGRSSSSEREYEFDQPFHTQ